MKRKVINPLDDMFPKKRMSPGSCTFQGRFGLKSSCSSSFSSYVGFSDSCNIVSAIVQA